MLVLQVIVKHLMLLLGTELRSTTNALCTLTCWVITAQSLSYTNQRTLQNWVRGMENRYGTTVAIRNSQHLWTLAPNTPKLGPVNNQPWTAEVFMEYSLYCCSTSYRYILREWKSSSSVVHLFLSSPGFRVKLQTHDIVYEKESIFFLYFLYSSLL